MIAFDHPVHGRCEVIDKALNPRSKSVLVNRVRDGAKLYLSTTYLETADESPGESSAPTSPAEAGTES